MFSIIVKCLHIVSHLAMLESNKVVNIINTKIKIYFQVFNDNEYLRFKGRLVFSMIVSFLLHTQHSLFTGV